MVEKSIGSKVLEQLICVQMDAGCSSVCNKAPAENARSASIMLIEHAGLSFCDAKFAFNQFDRSRAASRNKPGGLGGLRGSHFNEDRAASAHCIFQRPGANPINVFEIQPRRS